MTAESSPEPASAAAANPAPASVAVVTDQGPSEAGGRATTANTHPGASSSQRPPISEAPVSVILVASASAADLWPTVQLWREFLSGRQGPCELIVVGDGVPGEFGEQLAALAAADTWIRCLAQPPGLGSALRAGLALAGNSLLLYAPCDRAYPPAGFARLWEQIDHVDLVAGYRAVGGRRLRQAARDRAARWIARALFAIRLSDVACPVALARREVFRRIPIQSESWAAHTEVTAKANFLGFLMTETAVAYEPDPGALKRGAGESLGDYVRDVWRLFKRPDFGPPFLPPAPPAWRAVTGPLGGSSGPAT